MTDAVFHAQTPVGAVTLASDGERLTGLWFDGQRHFGSTISPDARERELPIFARTGQWLSLYFQGRDPAFTPPLRLCGTPFQIRVWTALQSIPYGATLSYGALAQRLGLPKSAARAVGSAVGRNPVSLIVPCHRVLGADGGLTGYAGGPERKQSLLMLEGISV